MGTFSNYYFHIKPTKIMCSLIGTYISQTYKIDQRKTGICQFFFFKDLYYSFISHIFVKVNFDLINDGINRLLGIIMLYFIMY